MGLDYISSVPIQCSEVLQKPQSNEIDGKRQLVFTPSGNFLFHFLANVLWDHIAVFIRHRLTLLQVIIYTFVQD